MEENVLAFDHHGFQLSPPSPPRFPTPPSAIACSPSSPVPDFVNLMTVSSPSCVCSCPSGRSRRPRVVKKDLTTGSKSEKKWEDLLNGWKGNGPNSILNQQGKLENLLFQGVPTCVRPSLWKTILESKTLAAASRTFDYISHAVLLHEMLGNCGISDYGGKHMLMAIGRMSLEEDSELLKKGMIPIRHIRQIMADLDRTYPTHRMFMGDQLEAMIGRASLFRMLAVYAKYNQQVGYCQGMSYIAGMLLMVIEQEDEAFWCFVSLLERHKYLLRYFDTNLSRLHMHARIFSRLLRRRHPRLAKHFAHLLLVPQCETQDKFNLEIEVLMFITPWFMSLFTCLSCWDTVLSIWDLLIVKGFTTLFQVSLAIISLCEEELLEKTEMSTLLPILLHLPHRVVAHKTLLPVIQATVLDRWEINGLQAIIEEEISLARTMKKRKRPDRENVAPLDQQTKRQKTANDTSNQGLFGKLVNMFSGTSTEETPKRSTRHRPIVQSKSRVPGKVRNASALGYPFECHISPCKEAREDRNVLVEQAKPPRRSPRLALTSLSNPNAGQATDRLVGESAKARFVFKGFAMPTPLRRSQRISASPALVSSPEVELKTMTRK